MKVYPAFVMQLGDTFFSHFIVPHRYEVVLELLRHWPSFDPRC